jgi:hypothetical protein
MQITIEEIDLRARAYERILVAYSTGHCPVPFVLDRSIKSLATVRKYIAETQSQCELLIDYLIMLALTARGAATDWQALEPWKVSLDEFEKRVRAAPVRGEPYPRSYVLSLYMQVDPDIPGKQLFDQAMAVLADTSDEPGEAFEPEGDDIANPEFAEWSWVIESNENRLDVSRGKVQRTWCVSEPRPMVQSAHLASELARYLTALDVQFAYGFRSDTPEYRHYLRRGLAGGQPAWLFTRDGSTITVHEGTAKAVRKLGLADDFPHFRS